MELLHHRLGHRSIISLMSVDTSNDLKDIELRIDPDTFVTPCQIYPNNIKAGSNNPLKQKRPFNYVLWTLFWKHPQNVLQVEILFLLF